MDGSSEVSRQRVQKVAAAALVWCSALLGAWILAGFFLYVVPAVDHPEKSDAVVVLAPTVGTGRFELAESLMSDGYGKTLVISKPAGGSGGASSEVCKESRKYPVICFSPDPVTTQGEARAIQSLSEKYGWRRITVVTNDFHIARARTIIERCYSYELNMAAARRDRPITGWLSVFVYESAALVKAAVHREC